MLKSIFFRVVDVIQSMKPVNWTVHSVRSICNLKIFRYFYNGKMYKYIGTNLPGAVARGFFAPIKKALWNGRDVTERVMKYAGPRHDFYGNPPELDKMFYKIMSMKWIPKVAVKIGPGMHVKVDFYKERQVVAETGTLEVTNILGTKNVYENTVEKVYRITDCPPLEQGKTSCHLG